MVAFRILAPQVALIALLFAAAGASAQSLEVLGPAGAVPSEGFRVALLRRGADGRAIPLQQPSIRVEHGAVRDARSQGLLRTWAVVPEASAREVMVRAQDGALVAEQAFAVGPPASRVDLTLPGSAPVKGRDTGTTIDVRIVRPDGTADPDAPPPVLTANVGQVGAPEPLEPGHFRARYELPRTRYPEVAVIVAFAPWPHPESIHGAVGSLLVPLASAIDLPGHTERNAEMTIEIAGRTFGPTKAGPDGRFTLPVVVPPGHRFGRGVAVDRAGNRRSTRIDLQLPPTDQLACVMNPRRLPADGVARARVVCAATDPFGAPEENADVELTAGAGTKSARRSTGPGRYEWIYTAPAQLSEKPVELKAQWRQGHHRSLEQLQVTLVQGAVDRLALSAAQPLVHYGGAVPLIAKATDALGRPRGGATVLFGAPFGTFTQAVPGPDGVYSANWLPPSDGRAEEVLLTARAFGPQGQAPATLSTWVEGGEVWAGVRDLAGWPVANQPLRVGSHTVRTGPDGAALLGKLSPGTWDVVHERWRGLEVRLYVLGDGLVWPEGSRPGTPEERARLALAPPTPVVVRVEVQGRKVTYWAEDPRGRVLEGRRLVLEVTGAEVTSRQVRAGKTAFTVSRAPAQISVADLQTGVVGLAEVPP